MTNPDATSFTRQAHRLLFALDLAPGSTVGLDRFHGSDADALRQLERLGLIELTDQRAGLLPAGSRVLERSRSAALGRLASDLFDADVRVGLEEVRAEADEELAAEVRADLEHGFMAGFGR